ncbi:MAG: sugar kinase [Sulfobacillus acidophilus]|uniref:Sugar kinase n=1 Tax=Sulfobacillus acidophilus TaxID=53633 RepID=A0A2T2WJD3_9FIRM|nr:MAG: sugar kinase [Sulfobacillus acidophilus]
MKSILTCGEAMGIISADRVGRVMPGSPMTMSVAGSEFNVAIALARLGVPSQFAGAVGEDVVGSMIGHTLRGEGVDIRHLQTLPKPTGLMIKERYGLQAEPRVYYYRQDTAMHQWIPGPELVASADWVHISGITLMINASLGQRVTAWLKAWVDRHPSALSIDLNVRRRLGSLQQWRQVLARALDLAAVIFASRQDLRDLWGTDVVSELVEVGAFRADQVVIVADGAHGACAAQNAEILARVAALEVARIEDVVGAGDGFAAGVLAGRWREWDWERALRLGAVVGAFAVAHPGDWEGYPLWSEARAVLEGDWVDR